MSDHTFLSSTLRKLAPEHIVKKADERLAICVECDKFTEKTRRCLMCGCFMDAKVFIPDAQCPIKKW